MTSLTSPPRRRESRWDRLPQPVRIAIGVTAAVVGWALVKIVPNLFEDGSPARWVYLGGLVVLAAVAVVVGLRRQRRQLGGAEQQRLFRRAVRTGEVPAGADREAWRPVLERARRSDRWVQGWLAVTYLVPGVLLGAVLVVVPLTSDLSSRAKVVLPLLGLALLALVAVVVWTVRRAARRRQALLDRL